jgi:hypothetical protein
MGKALLLCVLLVTFVAASDSDSDSWSLPIMGAPLTVASSLSNAEGFVYGYTSTGVLAKIDKNSGTMGM